MSKHSQDTNDASARETTGDTPRSAVGEWPEEVPRAGLYLTALLWGAWVLFLVWMMVLRLTAPAA